MPSVDAVHVHEFQKNRRTVLRTSLQTFEGRQVVDIREWMPRSRDGVLVPCAKGITFDRALVPELEAAVRALRSALAAPAAGDSRGCV